MYDKCDQQPHNVQRKQPFTREGSTGGSGSSGNPQNTQQPVVQPVVAPQQQQPVPMRPTQYVTRVTIVYSPTIITNVYVGTGQQQARPYTQPSVAPPRPQPVSQQPSYPDVAPPPPGPAPIPAPLPVARPTEDEIPIWVWWIGLIVLFFVIGIIFGCVAAS